jgi:hypothetical protein
LFAANMRGRAGDGREGGGGRNGEGGDVSGLRFAPSAIADRAFSRSPVIAASRRSRSAFVSTEIPGPLPEAVAQAVPGHTKASTHNRWATSLRVRIAYLPPASMQHSQG